MKQLILIFLFTVLTTNLVYAQLGRGGRGWHIEQNDPPVREFTAARWHFGTNGSIGNMGWSHNYPDSDINLNEFLKRATLINMEIGSYRIIELGEPDVFDYPFAYVSEPGEMELTDQEVINLREFVSRGGFILMDDFDGPWQWAQMRSQVKRAFPEYEFIPVALDHEVFRVHTSLDNLAAMADSVPGGEITYYGLFDRNGHLGILAGLNNDLANFWDWYSDGRMPLKPSTDAFRLGTNAVIYSFTH
jgi:hypothetical protein